jgi:cellulose synthase/poly-beta-1,6-N-acetylglucosamine synthase-like glycosyltransferase
VTDLLPAVVLAGCLLALAYVFLGYPLALRALIWLRGRREVAKAPITPPVTLVVSAFNEARVIRAKLENALALDYPLHLLDIVVISDASDDGTDEIVTGMASERVSLRRQVERRGKTAGLNAEVPTLRGDIVVFSDANAMYRADAIRNLVRNFADSKVGCVTGEARYVKGAGGPADTGEHAYWDYEMQLKRLETAVGSMVGGDGAIYGIRKSLWQALPENAINDFLNPLQIVAAGWRNVYEPEAVAFEETAGDTRREYKRRVRIVSRSWRAVFQAPATLNPARVGLFSFCLVSHKVMRWWAPLLLVAAAIAAAVMAWSVLHTVEGWWAALGVLSLLGLVLATPWGRRQASLTGYFLVLATASLVGVVKGTLGRVSGVWTPPREPEPSKSIADARARTSVLLSLLGWALIALALAQVAAARSEAVAIALSVGTVALLAYVYVGYPALIGAWARFSPRPAARDNGLPTVSVVVAAHNEAAVIADKVYNTLGQDYPADRLEVVVVSDGSADGTDEIVRQCPDPRVRLVVQPERRGKISAIIRGVQEARHDILVLTDANAFLEPKALRALVACFADDHVGAVSGDVVLTGDRAALATSEDLYYGYERWLQKVESAVWTMVGVDGALYAARRLSFRPAPADTILDDMAIPFEVVKAGQRVVFEPAARAIEAGSLSAMEEFWRKVRVVAGAVQFMTRVRRWRKLPFQFTFSLFSHKVLRWLTPLFLLSLLVSSLLLLGHRWVGLPALVVQLGFYGVGLLGCHAGLRRWKPIGLAHYFCLVQAGAAVGLVRGAMNRQSVRWQRFERGRVPGHGVSGEPAR